jgi:hypothetical protein
MSDVDPSAVQALRQDLTDADARWVAGILTDRARLLERIAELRAALEFMAFWTEDERNGNAAGWAAWQVASDALKEDDGSPQPGEEKEG